MLSMWDRITKDVVLQAWNLTGDAFTKGPGEKPWISEM